VIGSTVYLDTKLPAQGTGLAGTVLQQNNFALVVCSTTKELIRATGPKMLTDAKNIVCIISMFNSENRDATSTLRTKYTLYCQNFNRYLPVSNPVLLTYHTTVIK